MQNLISCSMASYCRTMPMESAMRLLRDAGFGGLDFPFSIFSDAGTDPMCRDDWRQWVREIRAISERLALPVVQAHATWRQTLADDLRYEPPQEIYFRTLEACRMLGCRNLIFHPLRQYAPVDSETMRQKIHDCNVRWFHALLPAAEENGVFLNLENTFDSHHVQRPGDGLYPYVTAQDMLALLRDIGSSRVRLCLDTGHANIAGQDIPAMVRAFRDELATLHLNDNYGLITPVYEDLHLFPGYGRIDWTPVFAALREIRFAGAYNVEPIAELRRMPDTVRLIQLRAAADTLRALADENGRD